MGKVEIDNQDQEITIKSHIVTYGDSADEVVTENIRSEIETMWNEPKAIVFIKRLPFRINFLITAEYRQFIEEQEVLANTDPCNNYFRIEEFAIGNISFVDGIGCNTGFFKLENLYVGSTTAAHEYGHTLGLSHPDDLDYRGKGRPSIMYPRGTLVDPQFHIRSVKACRCSRRHVHPMYRRVFASDIAALQLERVRLDRGNAIAGEFTNVFHESHNEA